jgi:hypothetical protein
MNKTRKIGILVVSIGLILLIVLIYLTFFKSTEVEEVPEVKDPTTEDIGLPDSDDPIVTPGDRPRSLEVYDINQEEKHIPGIEDISKLAMSFTERFGSFSSQSNFSNITDAKLFMTASLKEWADTYIKRLREENPEDSYYGITTLALSTKTINYNERAGKAEIMVMTHRRESGDKIEGENNFRQDLLIEFEKENDNWRVNAIYWQD